MPQLVTFGIPLLSRELSYGVGKILAERLEEKLDMPLMLRVCANYSELGDYLAEGEIDFAWLPPLEAAQHDRHGVGIPLLQAMRGGHHHYYGIVFVRDDSPLKTLEDLEGKRIAYVHRRSASGYLVAAALLEARGVTAALPPLFLRSHGAVVEAVNKGEADAGATFGSISGDPTAGGLSETGWELVPAKDPVDMRVIAWDGPIPSDAICAWPGTSRHLRERIVEAFGALCEDEETCELMFKLFGTRKFAPADRTGFDVLESSLSHLFPRPAPEE